MFATTSVIRNGMSLVSIPLFGLSLDSLNLLNSAKVISRKLDWLRRKLFLKCATKLDQLAT